MFYCAAILCVNAGSVHDELAKTRNANTAFTLAKGDASIALKQSFPGALNNASTQLDSAIKKTDEIKTLFSDVKNKLNVLNDLGLKYPTDYNQTNDISLKLQNFFTSYNTFVANFTSYINGTAATDIVPRIKTIQDDKISSVESALSQSGKLEGGSFKGGVEKSVQALFSDFSQKVASFYANAISELDSRADREQTPVTAVSSVGIATPSHTPSSSAPSAPVKTSTSRSVSPPKTYTSTATPTSTPVSAVAPTSQPVQHVPSQANQANPVSVQTRSSVAVDASMVPATQSSAPVVTVEPSAQIQQPVTQQSFIPVGAVAAGPGALDVSAELMPLENVSQPPVGQATGAMEQPVMGEGLMPVEQVQQSVVESSVATPVSDPSALMPLEDIVNPQPAGLVPTR
jgi:hypothetical protein